MTLIDWSDPEEMLGLLCEYVADERSAAAGDPSRRRLLTELVSELEELADQIDRLPESLLIEKLRAIHRSRPSELAGDTVLSHVEDCIEELERIRNDRSS